MSSTEFSGWVYFFSRCYCIEVYKGHHNNIWASVSLTSRLHTVHNSFGLCVYLNFPNKTLLEFKLASLICILERVKIRGQRAG